jgi:hypothetical protein
MANTAWTKSLLKLIVKKKEKTNNTKRAGGMIQVVEFSPSHWKVLNSNPITTEKKKNNKR